MNLNFALTLLLLTLMCGAGVVSAAYGFAIGREALRGITQPDIRPVNTTAGRKNTLPRRQEVVLLKEQDILKNVKAQMQSSEKGNDDDNNRNKSLSKVDSQEKVSSAPTNFPITSADKGVILEISSVSQQSDAIVLDVKLRNDGNQPIQFLYSFLNVTDEQGRVLSASTEGLPAELLPGSKTYSGTVRIPNSVLDRASKLSLTLTDYPEQQLRLQASGIPVVR